MSAKTLPAAPYAGLRPYSEDDAPFFFGREKLGQILIDNLRAKRLTLVYGASGVGKSSVLRAGVEYQLHRLAQENLELRGTPQFAIAVFREWLEWKEDPISGLRACVQNAVRRVLADPEVVLDPSSTSLAESFQGLAGRVGGDLLIILDQFEDYFLVSDQPNGEGTFSYEFQRLVNRPDLRVNFLISIREDAYSKLDRFKDDISSVFDNSLEIGHLDTEAAREAILKPIQQYNRFYAAANEQIALEPELVEEVLRQVRTGQLSMWDATHRAVAEKGPESNLEATIETPFLQLVMTALWKAELGKGSTVLKRQTLDGLGGAQKIVTTHLEQALEKLSESEKALAAIAFGDLVTPSGDKRACTAFDIAEGAELNKEQLTGLLEKLSRGNNRILRSYALPDVKGESSYEIFHDVLARPILDWRRRYREDQRSKEKKRKADEELAEAKRRAEEEKKLAEASARADEQAKAAAILRLKNRALALATAAAVIAAAIAVLSLVVAVRARRKAEVAGNVLSDVLAKQYGALLSPKDAAKPDQTLLETLATLNAAVDSYRQDGVPIGEGITLNNIGGILREAGYAASSSQDWDTAQDYYRRSKENYQEARAILERELGPSDPNVATSLHDLAYVYMLMGQYTEAEPLFRRALSILESVLETNSRYVADVAMSVAQCCDSQGKYGEAELLYERAVGIRRDQLRADHPDLAESLNQLAWLQFKQGKYNQAEPLFKDALAIWQAAPEPQRSATAFSLYGLAAISRERGKYKEAAEYLKQALAAQGHLFDQDNLLAAQYDDNMALLFEAQNDPKAVPVSLEAYQIKENGLGTDHPVTAYSATILASCYLKLGNYGDAEKYFNIALNVQQSLPSSPELARTLLGLAQLYTVQGKNVEAEPLFKRALAIQEKAIPEHPDYANALDAYAELLDRTDRKTAAEETRSRADRIRKTHDKKNPDN